MKENEYQCAYCKGVFEKGWSDEDALAEAAEVFEKPVSEWNDEPAVICDDCYNRMHPSQHPGAVERAKQTI